MGHSRVSANYTDVNQDDHSQKLHEFYSLLPAVVLSRKKFPNMADPMASLDVWLSAGGKYYEHWDMMRAATVK